jgi:hypothetical protein
VTDGLYGGAVKVDKVGLSAQALAGMVTRLRAAGRGACRALKETLRAPGVLTEILGYYRQLFTPPADEATQSLQAQAIGALTVPSLYLHVQRAPCLLKAHAARWYLHPPPSNRGWPVLTRTVSSMATRPSRATRRCCS